MKSGLTIVEMAQQIERQSKLKQDYLLDTRRLQVEPFGSQLYLHTFDDHDDPLVEPLEINQIAHRQIGTHLKIPAARECEFLVPAGTDPAYGPHPGWHCTGVFEQPLSPH